MKKWQSTVKQWLLPTVTLCVVIGLWQVIVVGANIEAWLVPTPVAVGAAFLEMKPLLYDHIVQTMKEAVLGLLLATAIGVSLAYIFDWLPLVKRAFYPLLVVSQTIPIVAIAPLFIIWFGFETLPKVMVVALVCFFPIVLNVTEGLARVDQSLLDYFRTLQATKWQTFRYVKWPASLPSFFSGMKIAATYSVMGAVIGEWLGASKGLGILLTLSSKSFLTARVFATVVVIITCSLLLFYFVVLIERLILKGVKR